MRAAPHTVRLTADGYRDLTAEWPLAPRHRSHTHNAPPRRTTVSCHG
eukprot:gene15934-42279_t